MWCKIGCCLVSGSWFSWEFSPFPDEKGSLCLNCLTRQYGLCWTHALILSLKLWNILIKGVPMWPVPTKQPSTGSLVSFPSISISHTLPQLAGEFCERTQKLESGFLQTLPAVPFSCWLSLYPFAIIHHSCEYRLMLSPERHPLKSSAWGLSWGLLAQSTVYYYQSSHLTLQTYL